MSRSSFKYWNTIIHTICILITIRCINQRLQYTKIVKYDRHLADMKHILIWTYLQGIRHDGQDYFVKNKCRAINCYFTRNRTLFGDLRYFDAIVFNVASLARTMEDVDIPKVRGINQLYVFAARDSADKFPVCPRVYDGFFNWTWTYRHDSTIPYKFISIYNSRSEELGSHFHWPATMKPIDPSIKSLLSTKYKAAVAILDECKSNSNREGLIVRLRKELKKYNLTLDIFGDCGTKQCKRRSFGACNWRLKHQYFFYLAMEDSIDHDFVTDVVLRGYKNNVVPIVYGGAKYNEYLPPNSYIDVLKLGIPDTAKKIHESIRNKETYYEYFKWRNHYQIRASKPLDPCALCEKLAETPQLLGKNSYDNFRKWWIPSFAERCWTRYVNREMIRPFEEGWTGKKTLKAT